MLHPRTVAQAVCSINESLLAGDAAATLVALKAPAVGIRSITDSCADTYQEKLSEARQKKAASGKEGRREHERERELPWC